MRPIIEQTEAPRGRRVAGVEAAWLTWSAATLDFVRHHAAALDRLQHLRTVSVKGCEPYESTYTAALNRYLPEEAQAELRQLARALLRLRPGAQLMLLRGMLRPPFNSLRLRGMIALLRAAIVELHGDARAALFAPISTVRRDDGFLLHADLFLTDRLLLIFDDIPADGSGRSLFLPARRLFRITAALPQISTARRDAIRALFSGAVRKDSFDRLYALLHDERSRWYAALKQRMDDQRMAIAFRRGEGYLLDDRRWLHGREAVSGAVGRDRFYRLTFGDIARGRFRPPAG